MSRKGTAVNSLPLPPPLPLCCLASAAPPFSTPVAGFQSLVVRVYLGGQLVGNAEGVGK